MFINDGSPERLEHSVEAFLGENLSIFQIHWIKTQSEALQKTKAEVLEDILTEWLSTKSEEACKRGREGELVQRAVGSFILRHNAEFLPVCPFR